MGKDTMAKPKTRGYVMSGGDSYVYHSCGSYLEYTDEKTPSGDYWLRWCRGCRGLVLGDKVTTFQQILRTAWDRAHMQLNESFGNDRASVKWMRKLRWIEKRMKGSVDVSEVGS